MMSKPSDILDNIESAMKGVSGLKQVSRQFRTVEDVRRGNMPYCQIIPGDDVIEVQHPNNKSVRSLEVWLDFYLPDTKDVEAIVERVRIAILADKRRGTHARNTRIERVTRDFNGYVSPLGFFSFYLAVNYKTDDLLSGG